MAIDEIRTEGARAALDDYLRLQPSKLQFAIIDLVTDLFHIAESEGLDPHSIAEKAELHYRSEKMLAHLAA